MEQEDFEKELQKWMKDTLSPYCLNECKVKCCDCCGGAVQIDKGYEHLFKKFKLSGKKIPRGKLKEKGSHLFKDERTGISYFVGKTCPNFDAESKKCLIHNEYPRCALYPIVKTEKPKEGYTLFSVCRLHKLNESQEPLKSLVQLCKRYGFRLYKEKVHRNKLL